MAKHQKPKAESAKSKDQKKHNKATKGLNTTKKGALWAIRRALVKNKKTGETREIELEVRVPHRPQWNPSIDTRKDLPEPYDALKLDWAEELMAYVNDIKGKLYKEALPNGGFEYRVRDEAGNLVFSVVSERNAFMESRPRRRRRRGSKK